MVRWWLALLFALLSPALEAGAVPDIIRSGSEPDYPPLAVVDAQGEADGFAVELLRTVAREMDREVTFEVVPWSALRDGLASGRFDVLPLVGRTEQREPVFDFSVPILTVHGALFVRVGQMGIQSLSSLSGRPVAVMEKDLAHDFLLDHDPGAEIRATQDLGEAFQLLAEKEVDAVFALDLVGRHLVRNLGLEKRVFSAARVNDFQVQLCFAVREGNAPLLALLNEGLFLAKANGRLEALTQKWLVGEYQPGGLSTRHLLLFAGILAAVLVISLTGAWLWNRSLVYKVDQRTRELEEATRASRFTQYAVEHMGTCLYVTDMEGRFVFVNQAAAERLGYSKEALLKMRISDVDADCDPSENVVWTSRKREAGRISMERHHRTRHGERYPVRIQSDYVEFGSEGLIFSLATEISYLVRQREALREAKEAAEQANRAKSEFLALMSHEIRTPMNGLLGMAELLQFEISNPDHLEMLEIIQHSGESLLTLIGDILDLSKIESGQLQLREDRFSPAGLLEDTANLYRASSESKGLSLELELDRELPPFLMGDSSRLRQILNNLVSNAIKFTVKGGLTLRAQQARQEVGRCWLRYIVEDTGIGIDPGDTGRIFAPFQQIENNLSRQQPGTGLGLAICKQLTERMGGEIGFTSEPGKGTRFVVTIPCAIVEPAEPSRKAPGLADETADGESPLMVLVVEDEATNREVLSRMLSKCGCSTMAVSNGEKALEWLSDNRCDLVLMDLQMPEMDGLEATRRIRESSDGQSIPVVAVTAHAMNEHRTACQAAGMNGFLAKPLKISELRAVLEATRRGEPCA